MTSIPPAEAMPWPGYEPPPGQVRLLEWSWAERRLREARRFWLATSHGDGAAHLRAMWAVWVHDELVFSTGGVTRKARNLAIEPRCSLGIEAGDDSLVVEGVAERLTDASLIAEADAAYVEKYGTSMLVADSPVFSVRPVVVIGFREDDPSVRPTRWRI